MTLETPNFNSQALVDLGRSDMEQEFDSKASCLRFHWLSPSQISRAVKDQWHELFESNGNWYQMYQTPEWWDYLTIARAPDELRLAVLSDQSERLIAVAPLCKTRRRFAFGGIQRSIPGSRFRSWELLGGEPLVRHDFGSSETYSRVIGGALSQTNGMSIYSKSVRSGHAFGLWLDSPTIKAEKFYCVTENGPRSLLGIELPNVMSEYFDKFSAKTRSTLRRKSKILQAKLGQIELIRVERPEQIQDFLQRAAAISKKSWQFRKDGKEITASENEIDALADLARQGLVRSYLLRTGELDGAFCLCYQYRGIFHYADLAFDETWTSFSPGIVLLTEILRDLWEYQPPRLVNFGVGEAEYKRRFSNCEILEKSVLFTNRGLLNWGWWAIHCRFSDLKRCIKSRGWV